MGCGGGHDGVEGRAVVGASTYRAKTKPPPPAPLSPGPSLQTYAARGEDWRDMCVSGGQFAWAAGQVNLLAAVEQAKQPFHFPA